MDASEGDSNVENFEHQITIKEELDERVKDFTFGSLNDVLAYENPVLLKTENDKVMPEHVSEILCNVPNIKVKEEIADEELQAGLDVLEKMNEKVFNEVYKSGNFDFKLKIEPRQEIDTNENDKTSNQGKDNPNGDFASKRR